mgnify:CR=1 FL=1
MEYREDAALCGGNHIDAAREQRILASIPGEDEAVDAAALFAHLSDSTRVRLLSMLSVSEMCVCEMADILKMSQPAVSHHLRILRQCGIVRFRKQGQRAVYSLGKNEMAATIRQLLSAVCERAEGTK